MSGTNQSAAARPAPDDDPFNAVAALPGVVDAVTEARKAVDRLLGHRILRRRSVEVSTESALRGARASAALEGVEVSLDRLRGEAAAIAGEVAAIAREAASETVTAAAGPAPESAEAGPGTDGAGDPVAQGALRVSANLGSLTVTWRKAPRQVLARLHVLAAADAATGAGAGAGAGVGRPRSDDVEVEDPLGLGRAPSAAEVSARLDALCTLLTRPTRAPALVVGALVHGELLALRPFGWGDGLVARAAERLTYVERGLDPKSLTAPEVGHAELSGEYAEALRAYMTGTPEGVARWVRHCADATVVAARDSLAICEALMRG